MSQIKQALIILGVVIVLSAVVMFSLGNNDGIAPRNNKAGGLGVTSLPSRQIMPEMMDSFSGAPEEKMIAQSDMMAVDQEEADKKIIKTGSLDLKVGNAEDTSGKISQIASDNGGEVFSSNFYQSGKDVKSGTIEVKVPVNNFEKTFAEIKKVANLVVRESTSGQDVTMEYADLAIQLKNKQAEEQSFLNILDRAGKIEDVLAVTREVARVRGEIESLQGRIKFMDSQTDKSTISVSLTEDSAITFSDSWRPWQVVKETFNGLFKDLQGVVNFAIVLIIRVIPVIILYALIIAGLYWAGKKIYLKIKG